MAIRANSCIKIFNVEKIHTTFVFENGVKNFSVKKIHTAFVFEIRVKNFSVEKIHTAFSAALLTFVETRWIVFEPILGLWPGFFQGREIPDNLQPCSSLRSEPQANCVTGQIVSFRQSSAGIRRLIIA